MKRLSNLFLVYSGLKTSFIVRLKMVRPREVKTSTGLSLSRSSIKLIFALDTQEAAAPEGSPTVVQVDMEQSYIENPSETEDWDCVCKRHRLSVLRLSELKDSAYFGNVRIKLLVAADRYDEKYRRRDIMVSLRFSDL